jgi:hypothetical protein
MLLAVSLCAAQRAPKTGSVQGSVVDQRTGRPVPLAEVSLPAAHVHDTCDLQGVFTLHDVPVGMWDMEVRAEGYETQLYPSTPFKSGENKDLKLELRAASVHQLEKSTSVLKMSREEVNKMPGAIQDVNRVIQTMPSAVGAADDGRNHFFVRGGNDYENIFLIDDIEVNNLSHWGDEYTSGGPINSLHLDFVRDIDFYAGGFPPRYPPRLSSITDIHLREGSRTHRRWQIDVGMAGFGGFAEGPILRGRGSYMLNARLSMLDLIEPFLDEGGLPKYQNGQAKIVYDLNKYNKIIFNLLVSHETIDIISEDGDGEWDFEEEGKRAVGGLQWQQDLPFGQNKILVSGLYQGWDDRGLIQDTIVETDYVTARQRFQIKDDLSLFLRQEDVLSLGFVLEEQKYDEHYAHDEYYKVLVDDSTYRDQTAPPQPADSVLVANPGVYQDTALVGYRIGVHGGYTLKLGRLKLNFGLRDDYYRLLRAHGPSPRAGVSLDLGQAGTVNLSSGLYYQFPTYVTFLDMADKLSRVELQRNVQGVLGYEKLLADVVVAGAEAYYKYYDREPSYIIVNDAYTDGWRTVDTSFAGFGRKDAYGFEVYLQKKRKDLFYYALSYTFFDAKTRYADGNWYDDDHNIRNSATLVLGSNFHRSHGVSVRFDASEGYPYTPIDMEASRRSMRTVFDTRDGWNSRRRDPRFKLSLRYDATLYFKWGNITAYFEGQNLLNQRDVLAEWYRFGDTPPGEIVQFLSRGILPIGGLTIDF